MTLTDNEIARARLLAIKREPLLLSEWERALFIHFEVEAASLQAEVPFQLDLRGGKAYVSLVAFTMRRMRPRLGGRLAEWCCQPMATHELLNLRAYVRHRGEPGIFFLAEWIPNRLSAFLGPRTFGLPYRLGRLNYQHHHERGDLRGCVEIATQGRQDPLRLEYHAGLSSGDENAFEPCAAHSLAEFLLERYTAFTQYRSRARFFRVWHTPWRQTPVRVSLLDDTLLRGALPCLHAAKLVAANYSPGVQNVWMGRPHAVESCGSRNSVLGGFYEMP